MSYCEGRAPVRHERHHRLAPRHRYFGTPAGTIFLGLAERRRDRVQVEAMVSTHTRPRRGRAHQWRPRRRAQLPVDGHPFGGHRGAGEESGCVVLGLGGGGCHPPGRTFPRAVRDSVGDGPSVPSPQKRRRRRDARRPGGYQIEVAVRRRVQRRRGPSTSPRPTWRARSWSPSRPTA